MNKVRNIGQKTRETGKTIFNWTKKTIPYVLVGVAIILFATFSWSWQTREISDTLYMGTIGAVVAIALVGLQQTIQIHPTESRDEKTDAHNARVIELIEEIVRLQKSKSDN